MSGRSQTDHCTRDRQQTERGKQKKRKKHSFCVCLRRSLPGIRTLNDKQNEVSQGDGLMGDG